jgi:beta-galactosidase
MVFIASEWSPGSATDVRVFSNCDEVALRLDGRLIARQGPDRDRMSSRLAHPPFTFRTGGFRAGTLEAVGYLAGREAARHAVSSPGPIERLTLSLDQAGRAPDRRQGDALFCHAAFRDAGGTVVPGAWENVAFGAAGGIRLATAGPASSDAGIASTVVRLEPGAGPGAILAVAIVADGQMMRVLGAAVGLDQEPPEWQLRYTTDGSAPGPAGLGYQGPVPASPSLRAAVLVGGRIAAELAADTPKFRIPASAPPDRRDPFRR